MTKKYDQDFLIMTNFMTTTNLIFWTCPKNVRQWPTLEWKYDWKQNIAKEGMIIDHDVSWSSALGEVAWRWNVTDVLKWIPNDVRKRHFNDF